MPPQPAPWPPQLEREAALTTPHTTTHNNSPLSAVPGSLLDWHPVIFCNFLCSSRHAELASVWRSLRLQPAGTLRLARWPPKVPRRNISLSANQSSAPVIHGASVGNARRMRAANRGHQRRPKRYSHSQHRGLVAWQHPQLGWSKGPRRVAGQSAPPAQFAEANERRCVEHIVHLIRTRICALE